MEDPKTPETLKVQSPAIETSEDISGFSGLADLSAGLTAEILVAENGVVVSDCSNEAEISNVELRNEEDEKRIDGSEREILDAGVVATGDAEADGGNGGEAENDQKEGNTVELGGVSTGKNSEVPGDGMPLAVDFLIVQQEEPEPSKSKGMEEMSKEAGDEKQVIENGQEHKFSVGDVIWVKTKSQTWWPGKIYPSDAAESDISSRDDSLLVGYFGSSHMTWCSPSQLVPFADNFEQMSGKSKSRSFLGAVEKAVDEFGRCVKLEMSCSCISERNYPLEGNGESKDAASLRGRKSSLLAKYSIAQYEPETFLARVKGLAETVSLCGAFELSILYNQLAAFQSSIGHQQLPLHQLRETHDDEDNEVGKSVRKSKVGVTVADEEQVEGGTQNSPLETPSIGSDVLCEKMEGKNEDPNKVLDGSMEARKRSSRRMAISNGGIEPKSAKRKGHEKIEDFESSEMDSSIKGEVINPLTDEIKDSGVENFDDESKGTSEKRSETRERKKSKYLSFPYINWGQKGMPAETDDIRALKISGEDADEYAVEGQNETPLLSKCSGKFWKKWYRNITSGSDVADNQELMSASPAEFLSELHFTAVDCLYPNEISNFDAVAQFFSRFRILMFHDESVNGGQNEAMAADLFFLGGKVSEVKHPSSTPKSGIKKRKGQAMRSELISGDVGLTGQPEICPVGDAQKKSPLTSNVKSKKDGDSLGKLKTKSLSALSDVNINIDSPELEPLSPNGITKRRKRKNNESHPQSKPTMEIPDLNGSGTVSGVLVDNRQAVSHVISQQKSEPKKRRKLGATKEEHSKVSTEFMDVNNSNKPGSFFIDLQVTAPQPLDVIVEQNKVDFAGAPNQSVNYQTIGQDQSKTGGKKRKRKEKAILSSDIPDLNRMGIDISQGKDSQLTKPKRRRRRRKGEASLNHPNPSDSRSYIYNRVETDGGGLGSLLLLTFSSEAPLPPREQVISTFSQFGSLKESEIQFKDSTVEIVFLRSADAMEAVRSLKKNNIFGPTLLKYQLYHLSVPPKTSDSDRACTALAYPASEGTLNPSKSGELGNQAGETPPIEFIRKNLQMMTSMLEKSGDNLSPDMRAKLESDIEGLLKKVSSMAGPSST